MKLNKELLDIQFNHSVDNINGWLSSKEQQILYSLAYNASGLILEIGPWCGKSTA
jgi:hypothetical protein